MIYLLYNTYSGDFRKYTIPTKELNSNYLYQIVAFQELITKLSYSNCINFYKNVFTYQQSLRFSLTLVVMS